MSDDKYPAEALADETPATYRELDAWICKAREMLRTIPALEAERDRLHAAITAAGEPYAWAVSGMSRPFFGKDAEADAQAEARRCGGTARAFPLYLAPAIPATLDASAQPIAAQQPGDVMVNGLTDVETSASASVAGLVRGVARQPAAHTPSFARPPLTDERRFQLWKDSKFRGSGGQIDWFIEGTRAAERAHGIGRECGK
jgi:hypothetical protein